MNSVLRMYNVAPKGEGKKELAEEALGNNLLTARVKVKKNYHKHSVLVGKFFSHSGTVGIPELNKLQTMGARFLSVRDKSNR